MKKLFTLAAALLLMGSASAQLYNLVKVTEVKDGGLYVFERNARVLVASEKDNYLQTTDNYKKAALAGEETYVWQLVAVEGSEGFIFRSASRVAAKTGHTDMNNQSGGTKITFANPDGGPWKVEFTGDVALLVFETSNRFLGESPDNLGTYRAYATGNLDSYGHDFTVYELQEANNPYVASNPVNLNFGTVEKGATVEAMEIEVLFGNLKGDVTYSDLKEPFSVTGTVAKSGDKLTVSVNPTVVGDYVQTLKIRSEADNVEAEVNVSVSVIPSDDEYQYAINFTEIDGFDKWESGYAKHEVAYDNPAIKVIFASANKQGNTITDMPVTKGNPVEFVLTDGKSAFKNFHVVCRQWTTKAQIMELSYSTDGGETYYKFEPAVTSSNFVLSAGGLKENVNALKLTFSSTANQVGIEKICFDLTIGTATAVGQIPMAVETVKFFENGQLVIIRDGIRYNAQGVRLQ